MKKIDVDKTKLRPLNPNTRYFEPLIRSIIFQQLSGKAAAAILKKFTLLFGKKKPRPESVL